MTGAKHAPTTRCVMSEPFRPEDVLFRCVPRDEYRNDFGISADEIVVVRDERRAAGLFLYVRCGTTWRADFPFMPREALFHLLTERAALVAEIADRADTEASLVVTLLEVCDREDVLVAERDVYRVALEQYSTGKYYEGRHAAKALEQGRKIRGDV